MTDMVKTIEEHQKEIIKLMRARKSYNKALDTQIFSLASAMRNLEMANSQIDSLKEVTIWEKTRYGEKMSPHPAFRIAKEAQELITKQMKALGLTAEEIAGRPEDREDPMVKLTEKLLKKRENPIIITRIVSENDRRE